MINDKLFLCSLFTFASFILCPQVRSQSLRRLTIQDGLASSSVLSIYQPNDGTLWMGTLDGMNFYYGDRVLRPNMNPFGALEGHIIEHTVETETADFWIHTANGLYRLERLSNRVESFPQFTHISLLRPAGHGRVVVLDDEGTLYGYQPSRNKFLPVRELPVQKDDIVEVGGTDSLYWVAGRQGVHRYKWVEKEGEIRLEQEVCLTKCAIKYAKITTEPGLIYAVDVHNHLYKLDIVRNAMCFVLDLGEELDRYGILSGIEEFNGSYLVSFKVSGVLKYEYDRPSGEWEAVDLGIRTGVFEMVKDRFQDLIWIATDGEGVLAYWESSYNIRSYQFSDFTYKHGQPVRALFVDKNGWLWLGTKGNGIFGIDRKERERPLHACRQRHLLASETALEDNSVYAFSASVYGGFWVGTEGGINFYNYATDALEPIFGGEEISYVHAIEEIGDSVLWIATVGKGVFKANMARRSNGMHLKNVRRYELDGGITSSNYFFAMHYAASGDLWLGNRGYGVFKMAADGISPISWGNKPRSVLQNDVFALYEHNERLWAGTGYGLVGMGREGDDIFLNVADGLPSNIVRSLQVDDTGGLWIATGNGLAWLSPELDDIQSYGWKEGLQVTEFSDGAGYRTGDTLYFGGMNGWVEISDNPHHRPTSAYTPPLYFISLAKPKETVSLHMLNQSNTEDDEPARIELTQEENFFSVSFMAVDYMNQANYRYMYRLDAEDHAGEWIESGTLHSVSFAQLSAGDYRLYVKYRNSATGVESEPIVLGVYIKPYWWQTPVMKFLYWFVLFAGAAYLAMRYSIREKRRHASALRRMEQQHKEDLYEEKLRFFTNITHEFSTPLTLIYSPCERILSHEGTDDFTRKYVTLIRKNAERLYTLIQEIIDYRRIETKHQQLNLVRCNVSDYIEELCTMFSDSLERKEVRLEREIEPDIMWNVDQRCFPKIAVNLVSNALKYTPNGGMIRIHLSTLPDDKLLLKVYNTGKGIKPENRRRIFNRYSVLDDVEENASGALSRNGLGMAICYSSVKLLEGEIETNSEVGQYAEFVVTLPLLPLAEDYAGATTSGTEAIPLALQNLEAAKQQLEETSAGEEQPVEAATGNKPSILVVDDNKDMLYLLREALSASYVVHTARSATEALDLLRTAVPTLIITDVMMPDIDGISFTRQIKQNKHTMYIPLIILSSKKTDEARTEGMNSGADTYIGKPFNVQYLLAVVNRLIASRKDIHEYYTTSACAYDFAEGQLMTQEDKQFLHRLNAFIEQNLSESTLTKDDIANGMNMSVRSIYRKLKELELPSPKDYLKERRMEKVIKLLRTSDLSIQEIFFECGFNNRAHFYKDFSIRYGMTPKEYRAEHKKKDSSLSDKASDKSA
jgi:signal transduction histidine kinase/DNA-binding response OmpR family regulator